ncbi:MAG: hypothetical protein K8E24_005910 [Methanobacterium paludis]|nr:hypothetical protein [Methanobacterium paludis]
MVKSSISSSMGISQVSDAKTAVSSIANAVNVVYANGPGAKRTVSVYIPESASLNVFNDNSTNNSFLGMNIIYHNGTVNGIDINASKNVNQSVDYSNLGVTSFPSKGWYNVQVYWPTSGTNGYNPTISITVVP